MKIKYEFNGKEFIRKITGETRYHNRIFYNIAIKKAMIYYRKDEEKYYLLYEEFVENKMYDILMMCPYFERPKKKIWENFKVEIFPIFIEKEKDDHIIIDNS